MGAKEKSRVISAINPFSFIRMYWPNFKKSKVACITTKVLLLEIKFLLIAKEKP